VLRTQTTVADELASTAELVIGQAKEGIPGAIVRGYLYPKSEKASAKCLQEKFSSKNNVKPNLQLSRQQI